MNKRPKIEIARAAMRLATELTIDVTEIASELRLSKEALIRWGIRGRHGVWLDTAKRADGTWYTSRAAVARFLKACDLEIGK